MSFRCNGQNCRTTGGLRMLLLLAGVYHVILALWVNFWPFHLFDFLSLSHPNHPALWRVLGMLSGFLGIALIVAAKDPIRHWGVSVLGLVKSIMTIFFVATAIVRGELPTTALVILVIDDLIWLPFFCLILWYALRAHAGIPPSRKEPYSIDEASAVYKVSDGRSLAEASAEAPLVLVFLRHFGCTFTRQILRGLQDLEQQAKENKASLIIVHMLQSGEEINYLGQHSDVPRIADPRCELYRAFGLGKGGFYELFGPHVWWRGMIAIFKGCGIGHLAGDGLQMPGAFLYHQGKVIASQPAHTAADLPDLAALFNTRSLS
jgi:hypothetical protein